MMRSFSVFSLLLLLASSTFAFIAQQFTSSSSSKATMLHMAGDDAEVKAAPLVTGEELEMMLTEWDTPLVVDAYATWCGPCLLMSPEYEEAAKELKDKVRFVKLDTDKEEESEWRVKIVVWFCFGSDTVM
jgi:thiol-disulfide isomerase/thioredoxin